MRPAEVTKEAIIQAGKALLRSDRNVTGFALRKMIGSGNPARLKQVWDEHIGGQQATAAEAVAELPIEVSEAVSLAAGDLAERFGALALDINNRAVKAAERRVKDVVRAAEEQREQADRELADAAETLDALETSLQEKSAALAAQEAKNADATATIQAQAIELAQLRERLAHAEQAATQNAQELVTARAELGQAREEAANLRGQLEAMQRAQSGSGK